MARIAAATDARCSSSSRGSSAVMCMVAWRSSVWYMGTMRSTAGKRVQEGICKGQFPNRSVKLFFTFVIIKNKWTDLCGIYDFLNTLCEMK